MEVGTLTHEGSDEMTSNTRRTLAELAHVEQALAANRTTLRSVAQGFQTRRTAVRTTLSSLEHARARLAAHRAGTPKAGAEDAELPRLEGAVRASEAEHARRLEEFERSLQATDQERSRIEQEAALLEGQRIALAARLPAQLRGNYLEARASGLREGIVEASQGACACGTPIPDPRQPSTSCDHCGRLVIPAGPTPAR
jgi:chromosome segregation ATPase